MKSNNKVNVKTYLSMFGKQKAGGFWSMFY